MEEEGIEECTLEGEDENEEQEEEEEEKEEEEEEMEVVVVLVVEGVKEESVAEGVRQEDMVDLEDVGKVAEDDVGERFEEMSEVSDNNDETLDIGR